MSDLIKNKWYEYERELTQEELKEIYNEGKQSIDFDITEQLLILYRVSKFVLMFYNKGILLVGFLAN